MKPSSFAFRHDFAKAKSARHQLAHRDVPRQLRCRRTCQNPLSWIVRIKRRFAFHLRETLQPVLDFFPAPRVSLTEQCSCQLNLLAIRTLSVQKSALLTIRCLGLLAAYKLCIPSGFCKAKSARHQLAHRDVPRQLRCRRTCQNPQKKSYFSKK